MQCGGGGGELNHSPRPWPVGSGLEEAQTESKTQTESRRHTLWNMRSVLPMEKFIRKRIKQRKHTAEWKKRVCENDEKFARNRKSVTIEKSNLIRWINRYDEIINKISINNHTLKWFLFLGCPNFFYCGPWFNKWEIQKTENGFVFSMK